MNSPVNPNQTHGHTEQTGGPQSREGWERAGAVGWG